MQGLAPDDLSAAAPHMAKYQKLQTLLMKHAAAYLDDAFKGRLENGFGKAFTAPIPKWLCFQIHASEFYTNMLKLVSLLFCWVPFFLEPLSYESPADEWTKPLMVTTSPVPRTHTCTHTRTHALL